MKPGGRIRDLKTIVSWAMMKITIWVLVGLLVFMLFFQIRIEQKQAMEDAQNSFVQIEQMITENALTLAEIKRDMGELYLTSAEIVAYILSDHEELIHDIPHLWHIASLLNLDEIWIFDETGRIISGTNPDFYGMTLDDGPQMAFFKPMLEDKTLRLAQEILPRTVDGQLFQYSAVWNDEGKYMIEVGRTGERAMKMLKTYDLSHILSILRIDQEMALCAVDMDSGLVVGSTTAADVGKSVGELGIELERLQREESFHARVNGELSYCVFTQIGENYIGRITSARQLYFDLLPALVWTILILLICAAVFMYAFLWGLDVLVLHNIRGINQKLGEIAAGSLEEQVESDNSREFLELSRYINHMVKSLRGWGEEREHIFRIMARHSNRLLYRYDLEDGTIQLLNEDPEQEDILAGFTVEHISGKMLDENTSLSEESVEALRGLFEDIHSGVLDGEADTQVTHADGSEKWYHLKYSSILEGEKTGTALISIEDITQRQRREQDLRKQAEYDAMTGLLRRDIGENMIGALLTKERDVGGILLALDLDDLKGLNDTLGHTYGDQAIIGIANVLRSYFRKEDILVRAGGDEFIVFLPNAARNISAVEHTVAALLRHLSSITVGEERNRTIHCSVGCAVERLGEDTFESLYRRADIALYQIKRGGKNNFTFYDEAMEEKDYEFRTKKLLTMPTREIFAMDELKRLLNALASFYQIVLSVNLSTDTYYLMEDITDGVFSQMPTSGLLTDFIEVAAVYVHPDDLPEFSSRLEREGLLSAYAAGTKNVYHSFRFRSKDIYRWVECIVIFYTNEQGDVCNFTLLRWADEKARELDAIYCELGKNISHRREELDALKVQYSFEDTLFRCLNALLYESDAETAIKRFMELVGEYYCSDRVYIVEFNLARQIMSTTMEWCLPGVSAEIDSLQELPLSVLGYWLSRFTQEDGFFQEDIAACQEQNSYIHQLLLSHGVECVQAVPLHRDGEVVGMVGTDNPRSNMENLTLLQVVSSFILETLEKRRLTRNLERLSYVDELTGLNNRRHFARVFEQYTNTMPDTLGIITLDINGLKDINEAHGHQYGDRILCQVAQVLDTHYPEESFRIGGDEFAVLCANLSREEFQNEVMSLKNYLDEVEGCDLCIGFAWRAEQEEMTPNQLQQQADEMRQVEKHAYYTTLLKEGRTINRAGLAGEVLAEIEADLFEVYYQPQLDLSSGRVIGVEALVRKRAEDGSIIPPGKFLPFYEVGGVIGYIDLFVLQTSCMALRSWREAGYDLHMSVNFSRTTLIKPDIVDIMKKICEEKGVPASCIYVEVTEKISKLDNHALLELSEKLRRAGFRISLDDFGSEYSNLAILTALDFEEVKIDRSLVSSMERNEKGRLVLEHILGLCHELKDTKTLAEGIESEEQLELLKSFGCDCGQGYYFSRPISRADFEDYLSSHNESTSRT